MPFTLSDLSKRKLVGVHPDLIKVVTLAADYIEQGNVFVVFEGVRSLEQQKAMVKLGHSKTLNSRHLTGHAVDLVPVADIDGDGDIEITWLEKFFEPIRLAMDRARKELNIDVKNGYEMWGWDMPHYELDRKAYPVKK
jgi:peptidoglycan L-alanyl-D-glutamate endopeptidase CwlK